MTVLKYFDLTSALIKREPTVERTHERSTDRGIRWLNGLWQAIGPTLTGRHGVTEAVWEGLGGAPSLPGLGVTRLEMIDLAFCSVKSLVKQGFFVIQTSK